MGVWEVRHVQVGGEDSERERGGGGEEILTEMLILCLLFHNEQ